MKNTIKAFLQLESCVLFSALVISFMCIPLFWNGFALGILIGQVTIVVLWPTHKAMLDRWDKQDGK